jgi:copper chaperone CopZ
MSSTEANPSLELLDATSTQEGCGCGGCGCGTTATDGSTTASTDAAAWQETVAATSRAYSVTGMTCGHCAGAVTGELRALDGVSDVTVDLVAGGVSTVTVTSDRPLDSSQVAAALEEAGDYQLA